MKQKSIVVGVYSFPEAYPPTLNAVTILSSQFDKIYILSRNIVRDKWIFPPNVQIINTGEKIGIRESEKRNILWKAYSFFLYSLYMLYICATKRPEVILLYDPIPLYAFNRIKNFLLKKPAVWYHNHDVLDPKILRNFSISKSAWQREQKSFSWISYFSLPSQDRRIYFPMGDFRGKYFFIPNLPALSFYKQFRSRQSLKDVNDIRIIYQGHIGKGHGIESIIQYILPAEVEKKSFILVLKGIVSVDYKQQLEELALCCGVSDKMEFHGFGPYQDLPALTSSCHVGIGIHTGQDIMNATLATASNKIFEYIALGLPVVLFDNSYFRSYFEKCGWALFTSLEEESLLSTFKNIVENYPSLSEKALLDSDVEYNFEHYFMPVVNEINLTL